MTRHPTFGAVLSVDWAGGTSYTKIGQVGDIDGPNKSRNEIEVPGDHDLTDNHLKYFAGLSDGGELTFALNLDPNSNQHVGSAGTGLLGSFKDQYNGTQLPAWEYRAEGMQGGTATWTFDGFVTGFEPSMGQVEGSMMADVTVKVSGVPVLTIT
jgi:hypothetical protein